MIAAQAAEEKAQLLRKQREMQEAKRKRAEARRLQQQQPQPHPGGGALAAATAACAPGSTPKGAVAAQPGGGQVHGVIHESSWAAARRAQQQAQHGRQ